MALQTELPMALQLELPKYAHVPTGVPSLTQDLNERSHPKLLALTRNNPQSVRSSSESDAVPNRKIFTASAKERSDFKIKRKWDGFAMDKQSPSLRHAVSPPLSAIGAPYNLSTKRSSPKLANSQALKPADRERAWPLRKGSVPDLLVNTVTTVKEPLMDSPTIPSCLPTMCIDWSTLNSTRSVQGFAAALESQAVSSPSHGRRLEEKGRKQLVELSPQMERHADSSPTILRNLTPLMIVPEQGLNPYRGYGSSNPNYEGPPPKVPPKSPRTMNRVYLQTPKAQQTSINNSPELFTNKDSPISTIGSPANAWEAPWSTPPRSVGETARQRAFSATNERSSPPPWSGKELQASLSRQFRGDQSVTATPSIMQNNAFKTERSPALGAGGHQRVASETSVMNRGRPTRKGETTFLRIKQATDERKHASDHASRYIPEGICHTLAFSAIPVEELRIMRKQTKEKAKNFKILRESQASMLSQELGILNERCEYLRRTYISLRKGRYSLRRKIVEFLNTPGTALFSPEDIVKQEDALAELDASIDEWVDELERTQSRRDQIRDKLYEHSTALLVLKNRSTTQSPQTEYAQTPPRSPPQSPVKDGRSFTIDRRDVESIRVYADEGVASLLASIEVELGIMAEQGRFER